MTRWATEAHFASWLGLCPDNRISGDRVLRKGTRHVVNRAATALRLAATTLLRSQSYLGAQYRRLRSKLGAPKAITAMAHKLARLVYRMLRWGHEYVDKGLQFYEERHRQQQVHLLDQESGEARTSGRRTWSCVRVMPAVSGEARPPAVIWSRDRASRVRKSGPDFGLRDDRRFGTE